MSTLQQHRAQAQVEEYRAIIRKIEVESNFFERLNAHKILAVADTATEVGYLQQLLLSHKHTLAQRVLQYDSKIANIRKIIVTLEAQERSSK